MIHGRSQGGKDSDELKDTWIKTLEKGFAKANIPFPRNVAVDFPFYADKLDDFVVQLGLPTSKDVIVKGPGQDKEYEQFMKSALAEIKLRANITDNLVAAKMDDEGATTKEKGPQNWWWVRATARAIDSYLSDVSAFTIEEFLKDVYLYVNKPTIAVAINRIIETKLTTEPTIVIGHSLGSVVGYKVLDSNRGMDVRKYITVGSPLGIRAISSVLGIPENSCGRNGWYNAFDERDIVALNPLDSVYFPADPEIINYDGIDNQTENRHGIVGYLNDASVARQIAAVLI